jgi:hypothetical protein
LYIDGGREMEKIIERVKNKRESQKQWKYEAIEIAIDAINGVTHRDKEYCIKALLKHLRYMPEIQDYDLNIESDECPF